MESPTNLDVKYQNLATEYSKLRANATVLKNAVLDEQARNKELKDQLKEHEQRLRKANQEMDSLEFRNQQLTKRISVLQEELEVKSTGKRGKNKNVDTTTSTIRTNMTLLDEELQKKIMDNAQLISAMTDKELEISNLREIVAELETSLLKEQNLRQIDEDRHKQEIKDIEHRYRNELKLAEMKIASVSNQGDVKQNGDAQSDKGSIISSEDNVDTLKQQINQLLNQVEHYKTEYELLHCQTQDKQVSENNEEIQDEQRVKEYFYNRIDHIMAEQQSAESMANSLLEEYNSLQVRLEGNIEERNKIEDKLDNAIKNVSSLQEELQITSHNYEQQLSTMSEHLADLNDKYTDQCETIQQLQFQLGMKASRKSTK